MLLFSSIVIGDGHKPSGSEPVCAGFVPLRGSAWRNRGKEVRELFPSGLSGSCLSKLDQKPEEKIWDSL